jgi:hypothetical protein
MLVGVQDVGLVTKQEIRHRRHNPFLVGTIDQQDGCILHKAAGAQFSTANGRPQEKPASHHTGAVPH